MRHAFTLLEILIVVAVMSILIGIALPLGKYAIDSLSLSSSASVLESQIKHAQAIAAERQYTVSVVLLSKPNPGESGSAIRNIAISSVTGQRYAGDIQGSLATVSYMGPTGLRCQIDDAGAGIQIHPDDQIKFNYMGKAYKVRATSLTGPPWTVDLLPDVTEPKVPPIPNGMSAAYPFVVYRRANAIDDTPLETRRGTCIDLSASGYGGSDLSFGTGAPIAETITLDFRPDGSVAAVRFAGGTIPEQEPTQPIFLCVGKIEAVGLVNHGLPANAVDPDCRWVRIVPQTGRVSVLPVGWSPELPTLDASRSVAP